MPNFMSRKSRANKKTKKKSKSILRSIQKEHSPDTIPQHDMPIEQTLHHVEQGKATPNMMIQLQRTLGNRAVSNLVSGEPIERQVDNKKQENNTGLPDHLKSNIEQMSGIAMDDVRVHYNSSAPDHMNAAAYTEGSDIYVGSGQESYLPHEAWHVIQQKQGRVTPSIQMKSFGANFDNSLEHEADVMGAKANQRSLASRLPSQNQITNSNQALGQPLAQLTAKPVRQYGKCGGSSGPKPKKYKPTDGTEIDDPKTDLAMHKDHWAKGWTARNIGVIDQIADNKALLDIAEKGEIVDVELAMKAEQMLKDHGLVLTETKKVQMYKITDTEKKFYTATSKETAELIRENGLDPQYGGTRKEGDHTAYNSIGHVYFGMNESTARGYGWAEIGKSNTAVIEFTLPEGHPISVDPEVGGTALRTPEAVPANLINVK